MRRWSIITLVLVIAVAVLLYAFDRRDVMNAIRAINQWISTATQTIPPKPNPPKPSAPNAVH